MNVIRPLVDTQPRAVSVETNKPAPRISWQEEQQQFVEANFQSMLEDGASRAFHEAQARSGAVIQSIKEILNGQPAAGSVTTIRQADGTDRRADVVPFRKSAPPPQRPRPPVQQPLRPAASDDLRKYVPDGLGGLFLDQVGSVLAQPNRATNPADAFAIERAKDAARELRRKA